MVCSSSRPCGGCSPSSSGSSPTAAIKEKPRPPQCEPSAQWQLEIVKRSDHTVGFEVLPQRWIVERTVAWLGRCRRLAKDYENRTRFAVAYIHLAMIRLMLRRLTRQTD